jgi:nonsense-mediated mRNA decay protein 3
MEEEEGAAAFCVRCGSTDRPMVGALCVRCWIEAHPPLRLPGRVSLVVCPMCGARQVGDHWEPGPPPGVLRAEDLRRALEVDPKVTLRSLSWEESGDNPQLRPVRARARLELKGEEWDAECATEVHLTYHVCPECSRKQGRFYTARLQLRGDASGGLRQGRELREWLKRLWVRLERDLPAPVKRALSFEEELKEGWDIYFTGSTEARSAARALRDRYRARYQETASLYSRKGGQDIYRVTFLLRLPRALPGDHLELEGRLYRLVRYGPQGELELAGAQGEAPVSLPAHSRRPLELVCGPEGVREREVSFPPRGSPFVRLEEGGRTWTLRGRLPPSPEDGSTSRTLRVALGERSAWWVPHSHEPRGELRRSRGAAGLREASRLSR